MAKNEDYGDDSIVSMSALQHYRFRPTMYGFQVNNIEGCLLQCKELVDNSVDEVLDPSKIYPILVTFFVSKDKTTYQWSQHSQEQILPESTTHP